LPPLAAAGIFDELLLKSSTLARCGLECGRVVTSLEMRLERVEPKELRDETETRLLRVYDLFL
jgi:hypothetical protein